MNSMSKAVTCSVCGRGFKNGAGLVGHMRIVHSVEKEGAAQGAKEAVSARDEAYDLTRRADEFLALADKIERLEKMAKTDRGAALMVRKLNQKKVSIVEELIEMEGDDSVISKFREWWNGGEDIFEKQDPKKKDIPWYDKPIFGEWGE